MESILYRSLFYQVGDALSNQRLLPWEVSAIDCWRFLELAKSLQIEIFSEWRFSQHFRMFTWVATHEGSEELEAATYSIRSSLPSGICTRG